MELRRIRITHVVVAFLRGPPGTGVTGAVRAFLDLAFFTLEASTRSLRASGMMSSSAPLHQHVLNLDLGLGRKSFTYLAEVVLRFPPGLGVVAALLAPLRAGENTAGSAASDSSAESSSMAGMTTSLEVPAGSACSSAIVDGSGLEVL